MNVHNYTAVSEFQVDTSVAFKQQDLIPHVIITFHVSFFKN